MKKYDLNFTTALFLGGLLLFFGVFLFSKRPSWNERERGSLACCALPELPRVIDLPCGRLAAPAGIVRLSESVAHRNGRDPRSFAELVFGEASSGGAELCAPASRKILFAGQSVANGRHVDGCLIRGPEIFRMPVGSPPFAI